MPKKAPKKKKPVEEPKEKKIELDESKLKELLKSQKEIEASPQFQNFSPASFSAEAPTLQRTFGGQRVPDLETNLEKSTTKPKDDDEDKKIEYQSNYEQADYRQVEQEMRRGESPMVARAEGPVRMNHPVELRQVTEQRMAINPQLRELQGRGQGSGEQYIAKSSEFDKEGGLPFQQETKYKGRKVR